MYTWMGFIPLNAFFDQQQKVLHVRISFHSSGHPESVILPGTITTILQGSDALETLSTGYFFLSAQLTELFGSAASQKVK